MTAPRDTSALGSGSISDLISKRQVHNPGKGYSSLMEGLGLGDNRPKITKTKQIETVTTEIQNFDPMIIGELLRLANEKQMKLEYIEQDLQQIKRFFNPRSLAIYALTFVAIIVGSLYIFVSPSSSEQVSKQPEQIAVVSKSSSKRYVTLKFLNMRDKPMPQGKLVMTISPKQEIRVLKEKAEWYFIEYTDLVSGKNTKGWVFGEYIKEISQK